MGAMLGLFDSGFGGLTILRAIEHALPRTDLVYLSDNAHAPYGDREPEEIFTLTLSGVRTLVGLGCPLIVVACNTASAQALRRIQQDHLPVEFPDRRALPPDVELIAQGPIIAEKLVAYLTRHPEINARLSETGLRRFLTTGDPDSTSRVAFALLRRPLVFERAPVGDEYT